MDNTSSIIKRGNLMDYLTPHEGKGFFLSGGRGQGAKASMHHLFGTGSHRKTTQKSAPKIAIGDRSEKTLIFISHQRDLRCTAIDHRENLSHTRSRANYVTRKI